jgi:hypothetical protein
MVDTTSMDRGIDRATDVITNLTSTLRRTTVHREIVVIVRDSTSRGIRRLVGHLVITSDPADAISSARRRYRATVHRKIRELVRVPVSILARPKTARRCRTSRPGNISRQGSRNSVLAHLNRRRNTSHPNSASSAPLR